MRERVLGDLGVGGKPHPLPGGDVVQQLGEDHQARAVADDMGMHGQLEQPPVSVGALKFVDPDGQHAARAGIRAQRAVALHGEVDRVIADPLHRDLHQAGWLTLSQDLVRLVIGHQ